MSARATVAATNAAVELRASERLLRLVLHGRHHHGHLSQHRRFDNEEARRLIVRIRCLRGIAARKEARRGRRR